MRDQDYDYFLQNIENLYKTYGHSFIAVKDRRILGAYDTFNEALENTLKTEEVGTFLIQECFANREECPCHFQGNVIFSPA
jgi:hypothetical protein